MGLSVVSAGVTLYRYFHLAILHSQHIRGCLVRIGVVGAIGNGSRDGYLARILNGYFARRGVNCSNFSVRRLVAHCAVARVCQLVGESCVSQGLYYLLRIVSDGGSSLVDGKGCTVIADVLALTGQFDGRCIVGTSRPGVDVVLVGSCVVRVLCQLCAVYLYFEGGLYRTASIGILAFHGDGGCGYADSGVEVGRYFVVILVGCHVGRDGIGGYAAGVGIRIGSRYCHRGVDASTCIGVTSIYGLNYCQIGCRQIETFLRRNGDGAV